MSAKVKLISIISAFVLVLGIMIIGVLSAEQVQVNIGGSVSFTATSVHAMITGSVQNSTTENNLPAKEIDASISDGAVSMDGDWQSMKLNFDENATDIIVTINIQNLSSDRTIYVNLTDNTNISNVNVTRVVGSETLGSGVTTNSSTITGGQTLTYTFTLSVASKDFDVTNGSFDLDIDLSSTAPPPSGYTVNIDITDVGVGFQTPIYIIVNGGEQESITTPTTKTYTSVETIQFGSQGTTEVVYAGLFLRIDGDIAETLRIQSLTYTEEYTVDSDMNLIVKNILVSDGVEYTSSISDFTFGFNDSDMTAMVISYNGTAAGVKIPETVSKLSESTATEGTDYTVNYVGYENIDGASFGIYAESIYIPYTVTSLSIGDAPNLQRLTVGGSYGNPSRLTNVWFNFGYNPIHTIDLTWCSEPVNFEILNFDYNGPFILSQIFLGNGVFKEDYRSLLNSIEACWRDSLCQPVIYVNMLTWEEAFNEGISIDDILLEYDFELYGEEELYEGRYENYDPNADNYFFVYSYANQ